MYTVHVFTSLVHGIHVAIDAGLKFQVWQEFKGDTRAASHSLVQFLCELA